GPGTVTITVTIADGLGPGEDYTYTFTITVQLEAVTDISGIPETMTLGETLTLEGTVSPSKATYKMIVWSVKDQGTTGAAFSGNELNVTSIGTVIVTATIKDGLGLGMDYTQDFNIAVQPVKVTGITGVPSTVTAGVDAEINATVDPNDATYQDIIWSVKTDGGTGASFVDNTLSATGPGTVTITATIKDGLGIGMDYTQDFEIIVKPFVPVSGVTDIPDTAIVGIPLELTGTVGPEDATNTVIIWSISDNDDGSTGSTMIDGILIATTPGTVIITVTIPDGLGPGVDYTDEFTIIVKPFVPVSEITDLPETVVAGEPLELTGTVGPEDATNTEMIWEIINDGGTGAEIVDGNILTTTGPGTVTIIVTIVDGNGPGEDYTYTFTITVEPAPVLSDDGGSGLFGKWSWILPLLILFTLAVCTACWFWLAADDDDEEEEEQAGTSVN
ncbi:MAG: hypothetical protein FWG58_01370, partial [Methanomassiliicoccaceae archaeon]|nr:hypothetical protein [Methanomassiliicoccaceae archaeon]